MNTDINEEIEQPAYSSTDSSKTLEKFPKKKDATVLVTAAGGIIGQGIMKSLRLASNGSVSPISYQIISADSSPLAAGLYRSDIGLVVPKASDPEYIDSIIEHLRRYDVDALFVGSDEELMAIANAKKRIEMESPTKVLVTELGVIKIARDKWETYKFLKANDLSCAESCLPENRMDLLRSLGSLWWLNLEKDSVQSTSLSLNQLMRWNMHSLKFRITAGSRCFKNFYQAEMKNLHLE